MQDNGPYPIGYQTGPHDPNPANSSRAPTVRDDSCPAAPETNESSRTGRLTRPQFDALDLLHTNDAHLQPIVRCHMALLLGDITEEAAHLRMLRLEKAGLVDIYRPANPDPASYAPSDLGMRLYRAELAAMDLEDSDSLTTIAPTCPVVAPDLQRALEATTLYHLTEPRGAA